MSLLESATHVAGLIHHQPPDVHSLAAADEAAELFAAYRHPLDVEQRRTIDGAMAERADGTWAASEVADFKSRQSGKGDSIECRELAGLLLVGEKLILHTAHEFPTANEAFLRMAELFENYDDLRKKTARVRYANGEQGIELRTGQRLKYKARTGGGGRGFAGADLVVLDEAQHLLPEHVAAIVPTITASPNAQIWTAGSGGLTTSAMAWLYRRRALTGNAGRLAYTERTGEEIVSIGDGRFDVLAPDIDDPLDHDLLMRAHPGYAAGRTSLEVLSTLFRSMGRDLFLRECLCIWMPEPDAERPAGPISPDEWAALTDGSSSVVAETARVAADIGNGWHVAAVAGDRPDGLKHGGLVVSNKDERVFVGELAAACEALGVSTVTLPKGSPGEALAKPLKAAGLEVDLMTSTDQTLATSELIKAATGLAPTIRHRGEPTLSKQFGVAVTKPAGNGGQVWVRPLTGDVAAVFALTMAFGRLGGAAVPDPAMNVW